MVEFTLLRYKTIRRGEKGQYMPLRRELARLSATLATGRLSSSDLDDCTSMAGARLINPGPLGRHGISVGNGPRDDSHIRPNERRGAV